VRIVRLDPYGPKIRFDYLHLDRAPLPVRSASWGRIKALYAAPSFAR
jgi:hypothetical protein